MMATNKYKDKKADIDELVTIRDKLLPPPSVGVHVGGGRHVDMPPTWDRVGKVPPGWSGYDGAHADGPDFSCELPKQLLQSIDKSPLAPQELAKLNAALAATPDLEQAVIP